MKAIVLCGGLGKRLGALTINTPKPMLTVAGRPFIAHVLDKLCVPNIDGIVLAAGFSWEQLQGFVGERWGVLPVYYSVEPQALGTGGAIALAMHKFDLQEALVLNGDTLFDIDLHTFLEHPGKLLAEPPSTCIALRVTDNCTRYGRVETDSQGRIRNFGEKGHSGRGLINGGIYWQKRAVIERFGTLPFSFESDYLAVDCGRLTMIGIPSDGYFIDIGIPADLKKAEADLSFDSKAQP